MTVFFVADMHFGNASNAKWRKFADVGAMDSRIMEEWHKRVGIHDVVWVLGDTGSHEPLKALPGTKHLIFGNDDKERKATKSSGLFDSCANSHTLQTELGALLLVHNPKHAGQGNIPVIHGHTHAAPDEPDPRYVSVSVDKTGWGPISLEEVMQRLESRMLQAGS